MMLTGDRVTVVIDSDACHRVTRTGLYIGDTPKGALVQLDQGGDVVVPAVAIWKCHKCQGPGEMRFRGRCWCEVCFDKHENQAEPARLEDYLRTCSPLGRAQEMSPDLKDLNAERMNRNITDSMRSRGMRVYTSREWAAGEE